MGGFGFSFIIFMDGALSALLWCAIGFAAWWVMFQAPLGRKRVKTEIRIKAPPEKIWSSYLQEPSPPGGWGGAVEIARQTFEGDPPREHRVSVRHGAVGPFRDSVWRIIRYEPNAFLEAEQVAMGAAKLRPGDVVMRFKLTRCGDETLVAHELRRLARGIFGHLYVPGASQRAFEHLRAHCEGQTAYHAAPVLSGRSRLILAAVAFVVTVGVISAPNPELWGVAAFVAFVLQFAMWLHEYGHLLAMRWFGHKDATLVMVPFLGGAAIGAKPSTSRFEKAVVALMGPALSALVVLALTPAADWGLRFFQSGQAMVDWSQPGALQSWIGICVVAFLAMAIPVNLFNLAPVGMLDGGRAVSALTARRSVRIGCAVVVFVLLAFAIAGAGSDQQIGAAVVFVSLAGASTLFSKADAPDELPPMTTRQLATTLALFAFTLAVYVDASRALLPSFMEAVRVGIMGQSDASAELPARQTHFWSYTASPKRS